MDSHASELMKDVDTTISSNARAWGPSIAEGGEFPNRERYAKKTHLAMKVDMLVCDDWYIQGL